jgi:flagellar M-ring protein FliF
MGYNEKRGDSLTVTNSLFTAENVSVLDTEFWKDPENIMLAKEIVKQLLIGALVLFFLLKILRPFLRSLMPPAVPALPGPAVGEVVVGQLAESIEEKRAMEQRALEETMQKQEYEENLKKAKQLAVDQPAIVASVVKEWVSGNG